MQIKYDLGPLPHNIVDLYNQYVRKRKLHYKKQASQLSTLCKLLKVSVGTVVLALPDGFKRVYVLGGIIVLVICGLLQCYSWNLLIQVIEEKARIHEINDSKEKQKNEDQSKPVVEIEMNSALNVLEEKPQEQIQEIVSFEYSEEEVDDKEEYKPEETVETKPVDNPFLKNIILFEKMNMIGVIRAISPDSTKMIVFIQIITLILFYGQAVSLIIFFNQTLEAFYGNLNKEEKYKIIFALFSICVIMGFSFIKRMEDLRSLTNMGSYLVFIVMYFLISICLFQIKQNSDSAPPNYEVNYGINVGEIPFFFGVSLFSYDINGILTEIREEMKSPQYFKKILAQSMVICCIIYVIFGTCGYIAYGSNTDTLITINLDETLTQIGNGVKYALLSLQLLYSLSMILTVILQNVVSIRLLEELPQNIYSFGQKKLNLAIRLLIRIFYISGCVFTATYFQNFTTVISLLGSITSVTLGFIMPYYLYKQVFPKSKPYIEVLNLFVLSLGVIGGILGVVSVFVKL